MDSPLRCGVYAPGKVGALIAVWLGATLSAALAAQVDAPQVLEDFAGGVEGEPPPGWEIVPLSGGEARWRTVVAEGRPWAQLTYEFAPETKEGAVYLARRARLRGQPQGISLRLWNDGAGHRLAIQLRDASGELFEFCSQPLRERGWQTVVVATGEPVALAHRADGKLTPPVELEALVLRQVPTGRRRGLLRFANLVAIVRVPDGNTVSVEVVRPGFCPLAVGDGPVPLRAIVNNLTARSNLRVTYRLTDAAGRECGQGEEALTLRRGRHVSLPLTFRPRQRFGRFALHVSVQGPGGARDEVTRPLAVVPARPPVANPDASLFGCNLLPSLEPIERWHLDLDARLLRRAGVVWTRLELPWEEIEPQPKEYAWAWFDYLVQRWQGAGLRLAGAIGGTPRWASSAPEEETQFYLYPPARPVDFESFVRTAVKHFTPTIRHWELWPRPNVDWLLRPDPGRYGELLRLAYSAVRYTAPDSEVLTGGFVGADVAYWDELIRGRERTPLFDRLALECFPRGEALWRTVGADLWDAIAWLRRKGRYNPPWVVRTGMATDGTAASEREQAVELVKTYTQALVYGSRLFWQALRDWGEERWGLLTSDFVPKPSYLALWTFTTLMEGSTFVAELDFGEEVFAYLFAVEDERRVILWREDGPHRLRLPWGGVRILDLWGNETAAPKEAGYSLALTSEPQYILGDRRLTALGLTSDKVPPG